jgi:uncharacterized membrane protein
MTAAEAELDAAARRLLGTGYRELPPGERRVITQILRREIAARAPPAEPPSAGERLGDIVAGAIGSWAFVAGVVAFLIVWVLLNGVFLWQSGARPLDPYPYLALNLILTLLAAAQAPVVMMSLNRQARRERARADREAETNLKVELEIIGLHEKIEAMRDRELADILAHQVELLQELRDRPRSTAA